MLRRAAPPVATRAPATRTTTSSGNTFNGPVYSQDELTTCGTPAFTGDPDLCRPPSPALSRSQAAGPARSRPLAESPIPYGYVKDPWGDAGPGVARRTARRSPMPDRPSPSACSRASRPSRTRSRRPIQNAFTGCIYTGPTMIRFYWNASTSTETMDVWSPLTKDTYASGGAQCGAIDALSERPGRPLWRHRLHLLTPRAIPTNTQVCAVAQAGFARSGRSWPGNFAQVTVAKPEVIWVQALPTAPAIPTTGARRRAHAESNATAAGCIDPWISPGPPSAPTTCDEGDAIIGGAVGGVFTLGASNNIVFRAVSSMAAPSTQMGLTRRTSATAPHLRTVLGLIANTSIWLSRPLLGRRLRRRPPAPMTMTCRCRRSPGATWSRRLRRQGPDH